MTRLWTDAIANPRNASQVRATTAAAIQKRGFSD
jgi:hypothetical protein